MVGGTSKRLVVLLGPPGAGKGTQAETLCARNGWLHVSTGNLLREAVTAGSQLGKEAEGYMKQGLLVPDHLILNLVESRLAALQTNGGVLLDGFPRNLTQAQQLEKALEGWGMRISAVVSLEVSDGELVRRLSSRRICGRCQRVYNLSTSPSAAGDRCEACGGDLQLRPDDREETIRQRLTVYRRDTEPLKEFYARQGLLRAIPSEASPEEVTLKVHALLREFL